MRLSVMDLRHLDFIPPDMEKFPCLRLAYEAAEAGGGKTVALNAADEIAVSSFLEGSIGFEDISKVIEAVLSATAVGSLESISEVLEVDREARRVATEVVGKYGRSPKVGCQSHG
jgi:1-deoxy-D-xylulose-5-phosphate reductoisomerase